LERRLEREWLGGISGYANEESDLGGIREGRELSSPKSKQQFIEVIKNSLSVAGTDIIH